MRKSSFGLIILLIFLTTYKPKFNIIKSSNLNIQKIVIENNEILNSEEIKRKLSFLYEKSLFFLESEEIKTKLKDEAFIESFSIKKIYPNTLKLMIV